MKPEELLRNHVRRHFEEVTSAPNPGHYLPKQDKFVEWTLFQILEQLKELNKNVALLATNSQLHR